MQPQMQMQIQPKKVHIYIVLQLTFSCKIFRIRTGIEKSFHDNKI